MTSRLTREDRLHEHRAEGNWDIYVMNADGTRVKRLTDHPADDVGPVAVRR